jgi:hypothetical protein
MIVDKGNTMVFDFGKCLVIQNKDPHTIMAKGVKDPKNGLYKLKFNLNSHPKRLWKLV